LFYQKTKSIEITPKFAEQIINDIIQEPTLNISPTDIIKAVAEAFEVSSNDLTGHCRKKEVVEPRQIAMYLLRDVLNLSYPSIGEKLGKRDHTTAIYAYEKIANELNKNQQLNQRIVMIKELITKK
jgi:chromosomal replication initiator protein